MGWTGREGRKGAILLPILTFVVAVSAQEKTPYPIFTADHFVAAMKTVGQAFAATEGAVKRNEIDDAKAYLAISRDRLATTVVFWRDRKKDDAQRMLRETLVRLDALDDALSAERVDQAAATAALGQAAAACERCHAAYREQDPATKAYRFKTGIQ
jgi:hypothetical protein